jgi:hypothetical protein
MATEPSRPPGSHAWCMRGRRASDVLRRPGWMSRPEAGPPLGRRSSAHPNFLAGAEPLAIHHRTATGLLTAALATVRLDGPVAHILASGATVRTVACPVLRPARTGCAAPAPEPPGHHSCPPAHRPAAGIQPRRDHDRRAADSGQPAARGQDRRDHHRLRHLPDHPGHIPRDANCSWLTLSLGKGLPSCLLSP